jgi:hypothetical protein
VQAVRLTVIAHPHILSVFPQLLFLTTFNDSSQEIWMIDSETKSGISSIEAKILFRYLGDVVSLHSQK